MTGTQPQKVNEVIEEVYNSNPFIQGSPLKLYKVAKKINEKVRLIDVKDFLQSTLPYTLHYPARRVWHRNKIIVGGPHREAQADLVDLQSFSSNNDGYKYLLNFIDCFTRFAISKPLKSKNQMAVSKAIDEILRSYPVDYLQVDKGREFRNETCKRVTAKNGTFLFFTHNSDVKAALVERFNRTLRQMMFRYFTFKGTHRYIDILPELMKTYNNSIHRSIRMAPANVKESDTNVIFQRLYPGFRNERELRIYINKQDTSGSKFKVGECVRRKYFITPFDHRFYPNYYDRYYTINKIVKGYPYFKYKLKTYEDKIPVDGSFYEEELEKVKAVENRIEVLDTRVKRGKKEYLIKYIGYPSSHNEWKSADTIRKL